MSYKQAAIAFGLLVLMAVPSPAAGPDIRFLRTQQVGDERFFHVGLTVPGDARPTKFIRPATWTAGDLLKLGCLPRLVPQDVHSRDVHLVLAIPEKVRREVQTEVDGRWEFVGRIRGPGPAKLRLLYPARDGPLPATEAELSPLLPRKPFREDLLSLDFHSASPPVSSDLRELWATAQAVHFSILETQSPSFSFFSLARELTCRKYGVVAGPLTSPGSAELTPWFARLYETAADATILAAASQARRLRDPSLLGSEARSLDPASLPRLDLPERSWENLLGDAQPEVEPLARVVPPDKFYLHFRSLVPVVQVLDLFAQINQTGFQEAEGNSRDYQIQPRYERQFAVQLASLARLFGPAVVRNVALSTGDPYFREGTDVSAVFQVVNRTLFYVGHDTYLQLARREFGADLKQGRETYQNVVVESFLTPRREISLYRTTFGDIVVLSNSWVAMKRIIDTYKGQARSMADAPDFRYYRSVYPVRDVAEDSFVYLSTGFLRRMLGPETFIKRRRRLEAFTSLYLVSNAALFAAWESGVLPRDHASLMAQTGLRPEEIAFPDGSVRWDGARQQAVSEEFNTFNFATPMVELPFGKVTPREAREYGQALQGFQNVLGKTLEPLAVRLKINDRQVRAEAALAPLPQVREIRQVLDNAIGGTAPPGLMIRGPQTLFAGLAYLSPTLQAAVSRKDLLGDWAFLRVEDTDLLTPTAEAWIRQELEPALFDAMQLQGERIAFQLPLALGVGVKNTRNFNQFLTDATDLLELALGPFERRQVGQHGGTPVIRLQAQRNSQLAEWLNPGVPREKRLLPTVWYAYQNGGFFASFRETLLYDTLDRARDARPAQAGLAEEGVNARAFLGVGLATKGNAGARFYLEWVNHKRALVNSPVWLSLFRSGLLPEDLSESEMRSTALRLLSFHPVSPEGASYAFDVERDEVVNSRHGSPRQPLLHQDREEMSPLSKLLQQFRTVGTELRFREDGLHGVVDVERKAP